MEENEENGLRDLRGEEGRGGRRRSVWSKLLCKEKRREQGRKREKREKEREREIKKKKK